MVKITNPFGQDINCDKISTNGNLIFKDGKLILTHNNKEYILNIPNEILYYKGNILNYFDCNDTYIAIDQFGSIIIYKINDLIKNNYSYKIINKNNSSRNSITINQLKNEIYGTVFLDNTCIIYDIETLKIKKIKTYTEYGHIFLINDLRFEYRGINNSLLIFKNNEIIEIYDNVVNVYEKFFYKNNKVYFYKMNFVTYKDYDEMIFDIGKIELKLEDYLKLNNNKLDENIYKFIPKDDKILNPLEEDIKNCGKLIFFVKNPTYSLYKIAIKNDPNVIELVDYNKITNKEYYDLCLLCLEKDLKLIFYIIEKYDLIKSSFNHNILTKYQIEQLYIYVISKNGLLIEYFNFKKYYKIAINNNGLALKYIKSIDLTKNEYTDLCLIAIKNDSNALKLINVNYVLKDGYNEACLIAIKNNYKLLSDVSSSNLPPNKYIELCYIACNINIRFIEHVDSYHYDKMCYYVIKTNANAIQYINFYRLGNNTIYEELCFIAIKKNGNLIKNIRLMDSMNLYELYKIAILQNNELFEYIMEITNRLKSKELYEIALIAISNNCNYINYIEKYSYEFTNEQYYDLWKIAVSKDGLLIRYINKYNIRYNELLKIAMKQNNKVILITKLFNEHIINNITFIGKELDECPVCGDIKELYYNYTCHEKHIICYDCSLKNKTCYYRCNKGINNKIIYYNTTN